MALTEEQIEKTIQERVMEILGLDHFKETTPELEAEIKGEG